MQAMSLTKIGYSVKGRICLLCLCLSLIFRSNLCKSAFCLCPVLFVLWYMDFDYFYVCVHVSLTVSQHGFLGLTISQFYVITRQSYVHDIGFTLMEIHHSSTSAQSSRYPGLTESVQPIFFFIFTFQTLNTMPITGKRSGAANQISPLKGLLAPQPCRPAPWR